MIERRTYAQPLYPGTFLPEEGASKRIYNPVTIEQITAQFPDSDSGLGQWFAIEVSERNWKLWKSEEGDEKWRPADDNVKRWRIYIGELLTSAEVAELPGDHEILLRNMEYNDDCDPIVRTRCGNFQPFGGNDVVIAPDRV